MIKLLSILTSFIYTIFDFPLLHYIYGVVEESGYFSDYAEVKGTLTIFKRLKKVRTIFRRQ